MGDKQKQFDQLIGNLTALGEDQAELSFWQAIFADLKEADKDKLIAMLQEEVDDLSRSS